MTRRTRGDVQDNFLAGNRDRPKACSGLGTATMLIASRLPRTVSSLLSVRFLSADSVAAGVAVLSAHII